MTEQAQAFWWTEPATGALRPAGTGTGRLRIRARYGTLSRGTERLVAEGRVPQSEWSRMICPAMEGSFPFPVKYGYCVVGEVEEGPDNWPGRTVFTLHPHQTVFTVDEAGMLTPIPEHVPAERAILLANMETVLNAAWDAPLMPGMRVAVLGCGVLGCLFARIARRTPGIDVVMLDVKPDRASLAAALDVRFGQTPTGDFDLVVEASGRPEALDQALDLCGLEGTLLVLSWYGDRTAAMAFGGAFHSRRVRLVSSQVGMVSPAMRPRVDHAERRRRAVSLLDDPSLDALIGPPIRFPDLPIQAMSRLVDDDVRAPLIVYDNVH
jgi:hypothetical protein